MKFLFLTMTLSLSFSLHAQSNLISNPGFESSLTGWANLGNTVSATDSIRSGSRSIKIGTASGGVRQNLSLKPGVKYNFSGWSRVGASGEAGYYGVTFKNSSGGEIVNYQSKITATSYAQQTLSFTTPTSFASAEVWAWKNSGSSYLYLDDLLLTEAGATTATTSCSGMGSITHEKWDNAPGGSISHIPLSEDADSTRSITSLEISNLGINYGTRISGYVCPPVSGNYTFYISGDDSVKLSISSSDAASNLKQIAYHTGYTDLRQINKYSTQKSAPIALIAGRKYFIEVLHKEDGGGDHVSVGWDMPGGKREFPLPASRLSPNSASGSTADYEPETETETETETEQEIMPSISTGTSPSMDDNFNEDALTYSGPIVITKGGTYRGNWQSKNSAIPAIEIMTKEPVIIENSVIRGAGFLIRSNAGGTDLIIRNSRGYGLTPTNNRFDGYYPTRRFLNSSVFKKVIIENNYLEDTAGILVADGYVGTSSSDTIKIRHNKVKNINGRVFDKWEGVNFVGFNYRSHEIPNVEIAWNQVINEPGKSRVEDNINLFNSRGTPTSPIHIHNNYILGAYGMPGETQSYYSGGGILTDSADVGANQATAYVKANDNQVINSANYGMAIAGGNNIHYFNNRVVNSGFLPDGRNINEFYKNAWPVGFYGYDFYKKGSTFNNLMENNVVGVWSWTARKDLYFPQDSTVVTHKSWIYLPNPVTLDVQNNEWDLWSNKVKAKGLILGPK